MYLTATRRYLFPYTTLFRSPNAEWQAVDDRWPLRGDQGAAWRILPHRGARPERCDQGGREDSLGAHRKHRDPPCRGLLRFDADRKSTRLNSSHGYISYAVFC